jgi:hypothetical protein
MRRSLGVGVAVAVVGVAVVAGASGPVRSGADGFALERAQPGASPSRVDGPARAASTWCGTPASQDREPNATAGHPVHWLYVVPSDGTDRLSTLSTTMQTDAELVDTWWRGQDPTRTLRDDLAPFSCGLQLDISTVRLAQTSAQLDTDTRFDQIVDGVIAAGFRSTFVKYAVYFDGQISEQNLCGQGGSDPTGFGVAVVYVRSCTGIATSLIVAHELLHTLGAVPDQAPHNCPPPNDGHVCDSTSDIMYPFASEVPLSSEILDVGRDDYYGHSGSWLDVQDSPWLVQLDRQTPFALTVKGPGSVSADVPGLLCTQTCTTTWNSGTQLNLTAVPGQGAKLVRWTGACRGAGACHVTVSQGTAASVLFAPSTYRLSVGVAGLGTIRSSRAGITCRPRCSAAFPSYTSLLLSAKPARGWHLSRWAGACHGKRSTCTLPMTADTSARAVFAKG